MYYCENCRVRVTGAPRRCPLCQGDLSGQAGGSGNVFPTVGAMADPRRFWINLAILLTVAVAAICVTFNLSPRSTGWWSLFVLAGLASFWIAFTLAVRKRKNIPQTIIWLTAVISIMAVAWDYFTQFRGWSIDYVVPILCTCAMIAMAVLARLTHLGIEDYIIYLIIDSVLGIVPVIFIIFDWLRVEIPSIICVVSSVVSLTALVLFEGPALQAELHRRTHL